jgi:hypothetical protein
MPLDDLLARIKVCSYSRTSVLFVFILKVGVNNKSDDWFNG